MECGLNERYKLSIALIDFTAIDVIMITIIILILRDLGNNQ